MPTLARVYLKAGEKALERGDRATAQRFFDKAHEIAPEFARIVSTSESKAADRVSDVPKHPAHAADTGGLGMRATELVRLYEQPREARDEATSLHRSAISHDFFGHYTLAQNAYRAALALTPGDLATRNNLALSLTLSGAYDSAVREMSHVTASQGATAQHRHTLEMMLQLALQQEKDISRLQATRDGWRDLQQTGPRSTAVATLRPASPSDLDRIAPSSGTVSPDDGPADLVDWFVRTVSALWTDLHRSVATAEPAAD